MYNKCSHILLGEVVHGRGYLESKEEQVNIREGGVEGLGVGVVAEVGVGQQRR